MFYFVGQYSNSRLEEEISSLGNLCKFLPESKSQGSLGESLEQGDKGKQSQTSTSSKVIYIFRLRFNVQWTEIYCFLISVVISLEFFLQEKQKVVGSIKLVKQKITGKAVNLNTDILNLSIPRKTRNKVTTQ